MQQDSQDQLLSTEDPAFRGMVEDRLNRNEPLVALLRFSHTGGGRAYFLVRSLQDFHDMLGKARRRDALSIFFSSSFPAQGIAGPDLMDKAIRFLDACIQQGEEAVFVIRLDASQSLLVKPDIQGFNEADQIEKWFSSHAGTPVLIGLLAFWESNSDQMVTAYVPMEDGQVRRGAY